MKKKFLILLMLAPLALFGHKVYQKEMDAVVTEADLIMIAQIMQITIYRETCETRYEYTLVPQIVLKGSFAEKAIIFYYSIHFWNEEKGCPSVHYILPPAPRDLKKGQIVIGAFKKHGGVSGGFRGTGIFNRAALVAVQRLIKK